MKDNEPLNVCVVGAGTMGSGIAAHLANLGLNVRLLDVTAEAARAGLERARSARPPHFTVPEHATRVRAGGIDSDLNWVSECDWVCEAIVEKQDAKRALYSLIEPLLQPETFISTNTSGLEISLLAQARSEAFRSRFLGTHFFNPPRYLKLIELIPTPETSPGIIQRMTALLEGQIGRRVVLAKDTPGFIANRFGMWAMIHAIHTAEKLRLPIEHVDAMTGAFLGRPRSASFRLNDIVGIDIMADIAQNLRERCSDDPFVDNLQLPASMKVLLDRGTIGDKTGRGYYLREGKQLSSLDLTTYAYREPIELDLPSLDVLKKQPLGERLASSLELRDDLGEFMRRHLVPVLQYANTLRDSICHSVEDFDRVMRWGFGWEAGPFEMIDAIGAERLGIAETPFYSDGLVRHSDGTRRPRKDEPEYRPLTSYPVVDRRNGFNVRDLGEGVLGVCLSTKMGTLNPEMMSDLMAWLSKNTSPSVLASEARSFSAGFDLSYFLDRATKEQWSEVDEALISLQTLCARLSESKMLAAVHGHCLGGGLEVAFACPKVLVHPEAQLGLPEVKVGLIPAGSGTTTMRLRHQPTAKALVAAAKCLVFGQVSGCADEAMKLGLLRPTDVVVTHPDRLIYEAREAAKNVVQVQVPEWRMAEGPLAGMFDQMVAESRAKSDLTAYDLVAAEKLKAIFCRAESVADSLSRERESFIDLLRHPLTQARIKHMIDTGKPLRN